MDNLHRHFSGKPQRVWRNSRYNLQLSMAYGLMSLVFVNALFSYRGGGSYVFNALMLLGLVGLGIRAARAASIVVYHDGIVMRKLFRTHRLPWRSVKEVQAVDTVSSHGHSGKKLVVNLVGKQPLTDGEIYSRIGNSGRAELVDSVVEDLNRRLNEWRHANPERDMYAG